MTKRLGTQLTFSHWWHQSASNKWLKLQQLILLCNGNVMLLQQLLPNIHQISTEFLANVNVSSEREREFTFAICCRPSACRLSVGNARAPLSGGWNFRQYFYGIRYLGHPLTSTENFTENFTGTPRPGELNTSITILDLSTAISRKRCKIGGKLLLITNRK